MDNPNIINDIFGWSLISVGVLMSIIIGMMGLLVSLVSGLNIPYRKKIFSKLKNILLK